MMGESLLRLELAEKYGEKLLNQSLGYETYAGDSFRIWYDVL